MAKRLGWKVWRDHLGSWERSGLTQTAYCLAHGLNLKTFSRWRGKALAAGGSPALTLVPVSVDLHALGAVICLHSPGGWRIELPVGHLDGLGAVLRQLP